MALRHAAGPPPGRAADTDTDSVADLVALSDERDLSYRIRLAWWRWGYRLGFAAGIDRGRHQAEAELERTWYEAAHPLAAGGPSYGELERRRWGPGGRPRFGDSRPGDFQGRGAA
jgi:hypothetical protein